ncbi:TlyA family RNA methyltransferase [Clostridium cellulovorans]|uniref:Hemolysin A n=1 Tax=Clostridium cellulovorans (strain ATCC 35296 / DSM 3052 / OCM 3 / 743B) TaxID=573061 RepID=D9SLV1_CLOC7|nr:TlyA family RNA methyltransferase [Clostridium cellulovorans]ADL51682.1 hemolysin A [Clostridium cellulovorans 743B]
MSKEKERLDVLLVEKGLFSSREKARAAIMSRDILVNGQILDKAGEKIDVNSEIEYKGQEMPYVSRGGYKLEKAMKNFPIKLEEKICLDIGASTGGFTDCMLQNGAVKVFAIDVGYGQLAWKLRTDERVVCMERTNVRYITNENLGCYGDFASIDVSFISLRLVLPVVKDLLNEDGEIVALIKPQFEAGREKVGKKGVVREASTHIEVIESIVAMAKENHLKVKGLSFSPIKGPEGNIEYLLFMSKGSDEEDKVSQEDILKTVEEAHSSL